jgi:hypothetical protein
MRRASFYAAGIAGVVLIGAAAMPVSGETLGSMGGPIKVMRGSRSVFLCCAACLKKVQADPDKYLGLAARTTASAGDRAR